MKMNDVLMDIHEFRRQRCDYPKFVYLGHKEFDSLMNGKDMAQHIRYDEKQNRKHIQGVPIFVVSEGSHFNLA